MAQVPRQYVSELRKRMEGVTDRGEFEALMRRFDTEIRSLAYFPPSAPALQPVKAPKKQKEETVDYSRPIYSRYQA